MFSKTLSIFRILLLTLITSCSHSEDNSSLNMIRGHTTDTMTQWRILDSIPSQQTFFVQDAQGKQTKHFIDNKNVLTLNNLQAGHRYQLFYGTKKQFLMSFTQPTKAINPSILFASCLDSSWYGFNNSMVNSLANYAKTLKNPNMIWIGDILYLNKDDLSSKEALSQAWYEQLSRPSLQSILKNIPNYAIWDDHDFGLNDADSTVSHKNLSYQTFNKYWLNPTKALNIDLLSYRFQQGDVEFFVLDNRMFRSKLNMNRQGKQLFGDQQMEWLKQSLLNSNAKFKLVINGGQFFNDDKLEEGWYHYKNERIDFMVWLTQHPINGLLFISGDRHHSTLFSRQLSQSYTLYELTCSALTSQPEDITEDSYRQVQRYVSISENNFCHLNFDSQKKQIDIRIIGADSKMLERYTLLSEQSHNK